MKKPTHETRKLTLKKLPGRIYQKYRKLPDGSKVFCDTWTVRYQGKDHSTGETDPKSARDFLRKLIGGAETKIAPWKAALRTAKVDAPVPEEPVFVTVGRILDIFVAYSEERELSSAAGTEGQVRNYLKPFFGEMPVDSLTTEILTRYKATRKKTVRKSTSKKAGKKAILCTPANGTINRELTTLKAALNYAMNEHSPALLKWFPAISMLPEATPRKGFVEHRDYRRLRHAMPDYLEPLFVTGYHVGRRRGELLQIELADVALDSKSPHIRIYGDATKSGEPSLLPIYGDMVEAIRRQIEMTRRDYPECPLLFHKKGKPIQKNESEYEIWDKACATAGRPGLLFHDLRRTACRLLIRAKNSRKEAMRISGHKTESAFERYHIVDESDMLAAVDKATAYLAAQDAALAAETDRTVN